MKDWKGNAKSIYVTLGASNHTDKERDLNDYYATDPIAVKKLCEHEKLCLNVWECACGQMHLADELYRRGWVYGSDLVVRPNDSKLECHQLDFLKATTEDVPFDGDCDIVTNPPYKYAMEFVLKALELLKDGHKCYMFLKLQFLEGKKRYKELFSKHPPKKVLVFSERVKCAKNGKFEEVTSSAVAYAWFVWEKGWNFPPRIEWI